MWCSFAFICDEAFSLPTSVALYSLIHSKAPESNYRCYIVTTGLSTESRNYFLKQQQNDVEISVMDVSIDKYNDFLSTVQKTKSNVSTAALLKFDLPFLLQNEDRILYLDGDIVVREDLSGIFQMDMGSCYVGAVLDSSSMYTKRDLGYELPEYFNSGVMLLNLEEMRKDNIPELLLRTKKELADVSLMDQNVLNIVMRDRIKLLQIKYNFMYVNLKRSYEKWTFDILNEMYGSHYNSMDEIVSEVAIVHYASKDKPWRHCKVTGHDLWFTALCGLLLNNGIPQYLEKQTNLLLATKDDLSLAVLIPYTKGDSEEKLYQSLISLVLYRLNSSNIKIQVICAGKQIEKIAKQPWFELVPSLKFVKTESDECYGIIKETCWMIRHKYATVLMPGYVISSDSGTLTQSVLCKFPCADLLHFQTEYCYDFSADVSKVRLANSSKPVIGSYMGVSKWGTLYKVNSLPLSLSGKFIKNELLVYVMESLPDSLNESLAAMLINFALCATAKQIVGSGEVMFSADIAPDMWYVNQFDGSELLSYADLPRYLRALNKLFDHNTLPMAEGAFYKNWVAMWLNYVPEHEAPAVFAKMLSCHEQEVLFAMQIYHSGRVCDIAKRINGSSVLLQRHRKTEKVALYFHNIQNGGIQRVISLLAEMFERKSMQVFVLTDEQPSEFDYPLPSKVKRCVLPDICKSGLAMIPEREKVLEKILKENDIDTLISSGWMSNTLLWDTITAKRLGVTYVVHCHNVSALWFENGNMVKNYVETYRLLDAAVVLSRVEQKFMSQFTKAYYVPNPMVFSSLEESEISKLEDKKILWIARMDERKHPEHVLQAFVKIVAAVPEATLAIVGDGDEALKRRIERLVIDLKLQGKVEVPGYSADVTPWYQSASVFVMTSYHEGFPMTLIESKLFGVPAVVYRMPYLEMLRENKGMRIVERGDIDALANEVIELLCNTETRKKLGREARESMGQYSNEYIENIWMGILEEINKEGKGIADGNSDVQFMVENIIEYHDEGIKRIKERYEKEKKSAFKKYNDELKKLKNKNTEQCNEIRKLSVEKGERWQELQTLRKEKAERWQELQQLRKERVESNKKIAALTKEVSALQDRLNARPITMRERVSKTILGKAVHKIKG